jgi:hypothetical protein
MIYQLARTSPLISGQVKMNMIMQGENVVDLQYTPISNNINFKYSNPIDVLNYTHGENLKRLYNQISDVFYSEVTNPELSLKTLHRYDTLIDDTHDNTYEMGMKRLEYKRYKKQFEFFCPFWCNKPEDLSNMKFVINLQNKNGRIMYSKVINFSNKIREYIKNIYPSIKGVNDLNLNELLFINFNSMQSYIKGINIDKGTMQTIDTSYIVNTLLYTERPVLEVDNMLVNLFGKHKIICPQLFNFNFVFDLEDFLPLSFLDELILERVNVFVDIYVGDEKCPMKDFYTNYEFIPKYDIYEGTYLESDKLDSDKNNVLNYLQDYKSLSLINKNKLTQGTFHWVLLNNQNSIFNLYNGFSPLYKGESYCNAISNDAPDLLTDEFNVYKNPFGVFKYTNISKLTSKIDFIDEIDNDDNFSVFNMNDINSKEYQFFGNILISNTKVKSANISSEYDKIKCAVFLYNRDYTESTINNLLEHKKLYMCGLLTPDVDNSLETKSTNNFLCCIKDENENAIKIFFLIKDIPDNAKYEKCVTETVCFKGLFNYDFVRDVIDRNPKGVEMNEMKRSYELLNCAASIVKCAELPRDILFDRSFYTEHASSPNINSKEINFYKTDKFSEIYRYDTNIIPMFIDLDDKKFFNNIYWCKQYDKTIFNQLLKTKDIDNISTYVKFSLDKYSPVYKSIGYYVLNDTPVNYNRYYLTERGYNYNKEISWYKANSMIYLPSVINIDFVYDTNSSTSVEEEIFEQLKKYLSNNTEFKDNENLYNDVFNYYLKNLYKYQTTYDYVDITNIDLLTIKAKLELK